MINSTEARELAKYKKLEKELNEIEKKIVDTINRNPNNNTVHLMFISDEATAALRDKGYRFINKNTIEW